MARLRPLLFTVPLLTLLTGCDTSTIVIRYEPTVGDELAYHSTVTQSVNSEIGGVTSPSDDTATLDAVHRITGVTGDEITAAITVVRDGATPRTFEARVDRAGRLAGIDLIEGVPAAALGIDVSTDVPSDLYAPPMGPIRPGTRWLIRQPVAVPGGDEPIQVVGFGRITRLDVIDGVDVAVAVVELRVPVRTAIDTADGRVRMHGVQHSMSETAYELGAGALWTDRTTIRGTLDVVVEPPVGLDVPPVAGTIDYTVVSATDRVS